PRDGWPPRRRGLDPDRRATPAVDRHDDPVPARRAADLDDRPRRGRGRRGVGRRDDRGRRHGAGGRDGGSVNVERVTFTSDGVTLVGNLTVVAAGAPAVVLTGP